MTFLILDSATERSSCALFVNHKIVAQKDIDIGLTNTRLLMPVIVALCEESKISVEAFDFVASGIGPGSFTGIRVACSIAKGIAAGLRIPLVCVSSLQGFIPYKEQCGRFVSAIDARMGGIFCIEGYNQDGVITFCSKEMLVTVSAFDDLIQGVDILVTPDVRPLEKRVRFGSVRVIERSPDMEFMGRNALQIFQRGEFSDFQPLYLRATQAEIEREQKNSK